MSEKNKIYENMWISNISHVKNIKAKECYLGGDDR